MSDSSLIDRIVAGVLKQLDDDRSAPRGTENSKQTTGPETIQQLAEKVITATLLEDVAKGTTQIAIRPDAIVTPAANDFLREKGIQIERTTKTKAASGSASSQASGVGPLLIVVHQTDEIGRLWDDLKGSWKREFVACPDDAAKLAIAELSRGGHSAVVIFANQSIRAACLANRSPAVKAAPVHSAMDVKLARKQIRVNTWCVSPLNQSWFELRNLFRAIGEAK
ncbi:MAG: hypothetical protein KDA88_07765 [Planctomycetaceae bacterium]|nr:hypothetical protein [Planctomycetaceae bacterium]MCB9949545.1 hypothetical protein [Planctomycetaceae bacterium]